MFEFLSKVPLDYAVVAANHVIRAIEYRQDIRENFAGENEFPNEPSLPGDQQLVALSIAQEIRRRENLPIGFLTDQAASEYTSELGKAVQRSVRHHLSNQEIKRGRRWLDQWSQGEGRVKREAPDLWSSQRFSFFLIGAGIGAALAVLFAPKSGHEFRDDIAEATRQGIKRSREAAQQFGERTGGLYATARETAGEYYEATRERAGELYDTATGTAGEVVTTTHEAASRRAGSIHAAIEAGKKAYVEKKRKTEVTGRSEAEPVYKPETAF